MDVWREMVGANLRRGPWDLYGAYSHDQVYDVPERLAGPFVRQAQGVTAQVHYRLTHSLLPSIRYRWMKGGGLKSDVIFQPGPRESPLPQETLPPPPPGGLAPGGVALPRAPGAARPPLQPPGGGLESAPPGETARSGRVPRGRSVAAPPPPGTASSRDLRPPRPRRFF